jgi:hypothetical protein
MPGMPSAADPVPDDVAALRAALAAEQLARREAEARASSAEAMVAHLKLLIAKLRQDHFGASSESLKIIQSCAENWLSCGACAARIDPSGC